MASYAANMAVPMHDALVVDVFSDVVCPWCFIGNERLEHALASLEHVASITVNHHPFALQPDTPPEGINIPDMLRTKYGQDPRAMFASVEGAAKESGLALDLSKQTTMYPTTSAHTLIRHAAAKGTQRALASALFVAYFVDAKNIGDVDVLAAVAVHHGFTPDEVKAILANPAEAAATRAEMAEAARQGIRGVPFFVFNQQLAVSGAQTERVFRDVIAKVLVREAALVPPTPAAP